MERIPGLGSHASEIRFVVGTTGLVSMGTLLVVDSEKRQDIIETTDVTPFSMNKLLSGSEKVGIPDQAVFAVLTLLFGAVALRGAHEIRSRNRSSGS